MKLEMKHLAPYLPYGVKGQFDALGTLEVTAIEINKGIKGYDDNVDITSRRGLIKSDTVDISNFKPLLIPLTQLNGQAYVDFAEWVLGQQFVIMQGINEAFLYLESLQSKLISDWPYAIVVELISMHFDVFGLIPAGLALSATEIEDNK